MPDLLGAPAPGLTRSMPVLPATSNAKLASASNAVTVRRTAAVPR